MRKIILLVIAVVFLSSNVLAFKPEIKILTKEEIEKLSDKKLLERYIDIVVEIEAAKSFHNTSGFMPKDYKNFKDMLRYRIHLVQEIRKRELELPLVE